MKKDFWELRFEGAIHVEGGVEIPALCKMECSRVDSSSLKVDIQLLGKDQERNENVSRLWARTARSLRFVSTDSLRTVIEFKDILGYSSRSHILSLQAQVVRIGIVRSPATIDQQWSVIAYIEPDGILSVPGTVSYDFKGEISKTRFDDQEVQVEFGLGRLEFGDYYRFLESHEYERSVIRRIPGTAALGEFTVSKGNTLEFVYDELRDLLNDGCKVLSFCFRRRVVCFVVELYSLAGSESFDDGLSALTINTQSLPNRSRGRIDELISRQQLVNGGLQRLLSRFRTSENKSDLRNAISFLTASYEEPSLQSSYFLCFAALELSIAILSEDEPYMVGASKWKAVSKDLRQVLDSFVSTRNLDAETVEEMKLKLPELRRSTMHSRIVSTCSSIGIETEDLWGKDAFGTGIKNAIKLRNDLVHTATVTDHWGMYSNLVRTRVLTERIILKHFDWNAGELSRRYDQDLLRVNSV